MSADAQVLQCYFQHAVRVLDELKNNLLLGCKPHLAVALAIGSLESFKLVHGPRPFKMHAEKTAVRIRAAIQLAIAHYDNDETIAIIGADVAAAMRDDYLAILMNHEAN